jgi:hypothetical protein
MASINLQDLVDILTTSISPVALISGIGLLLLSMTNRLGRVIDRARILSGEIKGKEAADLEKNRNQIAILYRRSKILRAAISCASISVLCASLIIVSLFLIFILSFSLHNAVMILFFIALILLITSIAFFIKDLRVSLNAFTLEIQDHIE